MIADMTHATPGQPLQAKGTNGTVVFDGTMVSLERTGMGRVFVGKGTKRIPIDAIAAVQWKKAGLVAGYMQFTIAGGNEVRSRLGRQSADAMSDENSVAFHSRQQRQMEVVRDAIEHAIAARHSGFTPTPQQNADPADRLARLQHLLAQGLINPDEFEWKRKEILDQL